MKRTLLRSGLPAVFSLIFLSFLLTSCVSGDPWYDGPSGDSRLYGVWEQYQADGQAVGPYETQYFDFRDNGRGYYYYYQNGRLIRENIYYSCQPSVSGASRYQINITYQGGGTSTINYWFTNGDLWMNWMTAGGRVVTYVYRPVSYVPGW